MVGLRVTSDHRFNRSTHCTRLLSRRVAKPGSIRLSITPAFPKSDRASNHRSRTRPTPMRLRRYCWLETITRCRRRVKTSRWRARRPAETVPTIARPADHHGLHHVARGAECRYQAKLYTDASPRRRHDPQKFGHGGDDGRVLRDEESCYFPSGRESNCPEYREHGKAHKTPIEVILFARSI